MHINEFIKTYKNHPVLFVGTGISLRYLAESNTWDGLLKQISQELSGNFEHYLDLKAAHETKGIYNYPAIATQLEKEFNDSLKQDRNGKFKEINDIFYENMSRNVNLSRFKVYVTKLLSSTEIRPSMKDEILELKKIRKNIGSIITTNYDSLIEGIFEFSPLIGNDILLSNPYGSVYKIHGCITNPGKIIITTEDYKNFAEKYELIRAQLLSIFIHNPIIFLGYNIGDENIKSLLKTIFTYIEPNSDAAEKIRKNFLLVEYGPGISSTETAEHDIDLEGFSTIRINKIKTDDYTSIYKAVADLNLPISAMDVRKVQSIVKEIYAGGNISVKITEDLDSLNNSDRILAIGSSKTIQYQYQTSAETMSNYFGIVDESNAQVVALISKYKIQSTQFFPIFGFDKIYSGLENAEALKKQQVAKLKSLVEGLHYQCKTQYTSTSEVMAIESVTPSNKVNTIINCLLEGWISLLDCENFLRSYDTNTKNTTEYRRLLCAYDYKKYGPGQGI
ncbi:MAG: SIR2 family protein [Candidatus Saccharibacteria bacterium]|nr:SIR2 family protein [Moraxellaceae bacterium]